MTPGSGVTASLFRRGSRGGVSPSMMTGSPEFGHGGVFDAGDQIEVILRRLDGRHERRAAAAARLDTERGANDPGGALAGAGRRIGFSGPLRRCGSSFRSLTVGQILRALPWPFARRRRRARTAKRTSGRPARRQRVWECFRQAGSFCVGSCGQAREIPFRPPRGWNRAAGAGPSANRRESARACHRRAGTTAPETQPALVTR